MVATRTPATADPAHRCIAVAYSAGRDSTALLHATARAAAGQGIRVWALHVHHGLSANADAWVAHAQRQCTRWAADGLPVSLAVCRLASKPAKGASVEAWARRERYRALRDMALEAGASVVLLAHHERDQAETFLLQALRGGGVAGLAGMPERIEREGVTWMRPWLRWPRSSIEAYVRHHHLRHVDDDSNDHPRFARNRLRLEVWPALRAAFPQAESTLADAATWSAEASACLDELAESDLAQLGGTQQLRLRPWAALSPARRVNVLRAWLRRQGIPTSASLVTRLQREVDGIGAAQWSLADGLLRRYRGSLRYEPSAVEARPEGIAREASLSITGPGRHELPGWHGALEATSVREGGVPLAWLARLDLKARVGGERFMAGIGRPARSLKKQYQAAEVPAWERDGPLVYSGGQLVYVPGLGIDARMLAAPGLPQLRLQWHSR